MEKASADPMVSVIMPIYNAEQYLEESILSVLNQSFNNFELILLPGNSVDRSTDICKEWARRDSRIRIIDQDKANLWYARNKGIRHARGKYFCACDADDLYCSQYLAKMIETAERENSDIVECMFYMANQDLSEMKIYKALYKVDCWGHEYIERHCAPAVWKYMVRREFWMENALEYPESRTMADLAMYSLVFSLSKKISYVYEPLYIYRVFDDSISHKKTKADIKLDAFEKVCKFITEQFKYRKLFDSKRLVLLSQIENHAGDLFAAIEDLDYGIIAERISDTIKKYYATSHTIFDYGVFGWGRHDLEKMILQLRKNPAKDIAFVSDVELYNLVSPKLHQELTELIKGNSFDIVVLDFMNEALSIRSELSNISVYIKQWAMGAQILASTLKANGSPVVYLLERYLAETYYKDGEETYFEDIEIIRMTNSIIKRMYDSFMNMYLETELIKAVPMNQNVSDDKDNPVLQDLLTSFYYEEIMDTIHLKA